MSDLDPVKSTSTIIGVEDMNMNSILSNKDIKIHVDHEVDADEAIIMALGYKQEFKREFSLWTTFCVSFSVLGLLPSIATTMDYSTLVVGISPLPWLVGIIGISFVALSLAEVASAFPTSGGLYYAVKQLSPPGKIGACLSWLVGWSNWMVQITGSPSVNYGGACMMLALYSYQTPSYVPSNGHIYGLTTGISFVHAIIASMPTRWLALFNSCGTVSNLIFLVIVFIMILAADNRTSQDLSKYNSNGIAWSLENQTEWPVGISFLMSFLGVLWSMSGYDSPYHIAEECSNANIATPRAIVLTATVGGVMGFAFLIAVSYTIVDLDAIANDDLGLGQPFVSFLVQVMSRKLVIVATTFTIISSFFMGCSCMLAASRVTFSYSRDGCFPGSKWWKKVHPLTQTPVNAVWINWFIGQLLLLLIFAGDTAIGAIFSVGAIAGFISFSFPTFMKITYANSFFKPGPWNLGKFSRPIGALACLFVLLMIPIMCLPYSRGADNTPDEMNWTVVVYFGPMSIALLWFLVDAHKWFTGPKSNLDPEMFYNTQSIQGILAERLESGEEVIIAGGEKS